MGVTAIFQQAAPDTRTVVTVKLASGYEPIEHEGAEDEEVAPDDGACWRIIVNWDDDKPYYYVDFTYHSGNHSLDVAGYRSGRDTPLFEGNTTDFAEWPLPVRVCFTPEALAVRVEPPELGDENEWLDYTTDIGSVCATPKCGLANGGNTPICFDDFKYSLHEKAVQEEDPNCPRCVCWCGDHVLPRTLTAVVTGWGCCGEQPPPDGCKGCEAIDGEEIELTWLPQGLDPDHQHVWYGSKVIGPEGDKEEFEVVLECDFKPETCAAFHVEAREVNSGECCDWILDQEDCAPGTDNCQCDPFILQTNMWDNDEQNQEDTCSVCIKVNEGRTKPCGGYYITITE